jgi:hypothetical protein
MALMALPLLGVRVAHTTDPSLWLATVLWLLAGVAILLWVRMLRMSGVPIHGGLLVAAGALSNGLVLLANGGVMPVHGMSPAADAGVWRSTDHGGHLLFLADRMSLGGSSPGDLLVLAGVLFTFGAMFAQCVHVAREQARSRAVVS